MTARISWTGLQRWEACHHHHLRTVQGKTLPRLGRMFLPGNVCDLAMRQWLSTDNPEPGGMVAMVPDIFRRLTEPSSDAERADSDARPVRWRGESDRRKVLDFCFEVVRGLEPILERLVLPYKWQADVGFEAPIGIPAPDGKQGTVLLIGRLDVLVQDDHGDFAVYDLKATARHQYMSKTLGQGVFYDIGIGHWLGDSSQPKRVAFIAPATREPFVPVTVSDEDRRALMARVIRMAHGVWEGDWRPKEDDIGCSVCTTRHACDKFAVLGAADMVGRNRADFEATAKFRDGVPLERKDAVSA